MESECSVDADVEADERAVVVPAVGGGVVVVATAGVTSIGADEDGVDVAVGASVGAGVEAGPGTAIGAGVGAAADCGGGSGAGTEASPGGCPAPVSSGVGVWKGGRVVAARGVGL